MTQAIDAVDVVVWGGGTGGVAAAIQAARGGASTLLLTPGSWLGGMVSAAGVCCPDGNELTPWQTGLWGAFLRELERQEPTGLDHNWVSCFGYRPATAETILQGWVQAEAKLLWWPQCRLLAVDRSGSLITAVRVEHAGHQHRVRCRIAIDGSDRGDLLPLAAAPFRLGWEPTELWNEPSAPAQQRLQAEQFFVEQPVQSPTWVVMGQLQSGSLEATEALAFDAGGQMLLPKPFEQACATFGLERTITYGRLPGGLVMLNWPLHGNDWHSGLERAFLADPQAEAELFEQMQALSLRFADALSDASEGWLQLGRAFATEAGSPAPWLAAMPYWREGRRMVGRQTVIEQQLLPQGEGPSLAPLPLDQAGALQSIAVGNYANDHHYPGPDWPLAAKSCRWGGRWTGTPFCIPYGALVSADIDNLLAADKAFSTSHVANGATRLQPLILNIGQAAGAAAALSVQLDSMPPSLPLRTLQQVLIEDSQAPCAVVPLWNTPWHHPQWRQRQLDALDKPSEVAVMQGLSAGEQPTGQSDSGHESRFTGLLSPNGTGGFNLACSDGTTWPVITLEPWVHQWFSELDGAKSVELIACANPWGPWLRVSGLAG